MTPMTETDIRRVRDESTERLNASRPSRFDWSFLRDPVTAERLLRAKASIGAAETPDATYDAIAEVENIFAVVFADFTAIFEALACPHCRQPAPYCAHTDLHPAYGGTTPPAAMGALGRRLLAAAEALRMELTRTRTSRIAERFTEIRARTTAHAEVANAITG